MSWQTVIGLEVHAQLRTESKIFSGSSTRFGAEPNTQANVIDLGYPGVLPVLNAEAVRMAVAFGLAVDAEVATRSVFARKNYFYPDLPKGYQISQYELPIVGRGQLLIELEDGSSKRIGITRAHLEEDAGKSLHDSMHEGSGIDLNRAGTPLLEIVSEPDLSNATEAVAYLRKIRAIVQYLDICDGNMQEGSLRCDANVSVRRQGQAALGTRTEIKNLNSFRFIEKAINFEVDRQIDLLEEGGTVDQETRLFDSDQGVTRPMRSKEEANDYRYFPDPDLLPVVIDQEYIEAVRGSMPELPDQRLRRFVETMGLSHYDASVLTASRPLADYFERAAQGLPEPKLAANWVMVELSGALNREGREITESPIDAAGLNRLLQRIVDNTISGKIAKQVFEHMWAGESDPDAVIEAQGLRQITDSSAIASVVDQVLAANPSQVEQYKAGKHQVIGYLVGQVMKRSGGRANPKHVNEVLREKLK